MKRFGKKLRTLRKRLVCWQEYRSAGLTTPPRMGEIHDFISHDTIIVYFFCPRYSPLNPTIHQNTIDRPSPRRYCEPVNGSRNAAPSLGVTWLIAYSASAVIVRLGLTPGLPGTIEPSTTYSPG